MATEKELIANRPNQIARPTKKEARVDTQLDENAAAGQALSPQRAGNEKHPWSENGFVFANDQISLPEMGVLSRPCAAVEKYPWPENGVVFSNDGFVLSIHNGVYAVPVMRPGFQWRAPVSRPNSRRKKRPARPHYN
jgi:hypothetical protein